MSAVIESEQTQPESEARTEPESEARESLSRLALSPSPTLIFEVDAGGAADAGALARRWDVRLVGSVRNRQRRGAGDNGAGEVSAVLIIRAMTPTALLACVRSMTRGGASVPPEMLTHLIARADGTPAGSPEELTNREVAVLRMLADGSTHARDRRGPELLRADRQEHRPRSARKAQLPDASARRGARRPARSDLIRLVAP